MTTQISPATYCDTIPLVIRSAAVIVYGGGITLLFTLLIMIYRRNPYPEILLIVSFLTTLITNTNPEGRIWACFSFFFSPFKDQYTIFSVLILLRRLAISLIVSLVPVNSSLAYGLNSLVLASSHIIFMFTRPYKTETDNNLELSLGPVLMFAYGIT